MKILEVKLSPGTGCGHIKVVFQNDNGISEERLYHMNDFADNAPLQPHDTVHAFLKGACHKPKTREEIKQQVEGLTFSNII